MIEWGGEGSIFYIVLLSRIFYRKANDIDAYREQGFYLERRSPLIPWLSYEYIMYFYI